MKSPERRRRPSRLAAVAAVLAAGCLLLAVPVALSGGAAQGDEGPSTAPTFTIGTTNEIDSFNPFLGIESESFEGWALMYDYMITYSAKDMSPEPGLATKWSTADDGLTWTFDIRSGVRWSDGKPLTARDIAYTYDRILNGSVESASWSSYLAQVETVTAPNATTVRMTLKKPNAILPLLPIPIIPKHVWKNVDGKQVKSYPNEPVNGKPVVGSGPFRLVEGKAGGSLYRFEANPSYWQGQPHISEVVMRVYKADDPLVQALIKGEVDFAENLKPLQIRALDGNDDITAQLGDSPGFDEIAFNAGAVDTDTDKPIGDGNPVLKDPKFRFALGYGLDRDELARKVYQGGAAPGEVIIPPAYEGYHYLPPEEDTFTYDPDRAGELLDEAGYTVGTDGKRVRPDGKPIGTLRLAARSDSATSVGTMQYVKEWFDDLGLETKVTPMESGKLTDAIYAGDFDIFQWGWYVEPDPNSMLDYMTCDQRGGWSDSWYCNPDYDKLFAAQTTEMDLTKRQDTVKEMQKILYYDAPYQVTAFNKVGEAYRSDRFHCFTQQPDPGGILLFQYGIRNYLQMRPTDQPCDGDEAVASAGGSGDDTSAIVLAGLVGAALAFAAGGALGGFVGYRRASVDFRE